MNNTRICPKCNITITYASKYTFRNATLNNSKCKLCAIKQINIENILSGRLKGENHPNFGVKYSEERRKQMSDNAADMSGKKNPMFGKTFYDCWLVKYGKEIADQKQLEYRHKLSIARRGEKNSMFGKPSPQGSGNGWSGWYKGWYFRSLLELSYMIKVIERFGLKWKSAECKELSIPYINWENKPRNYFADFLVNDNYLIECKPKKLHGSVSVQSKASGSKIFCKQRGLTYKLRCIRILDKSIIRNLVESGKITLLPRYQKKYEDRYKNI